MAKVIQLLEITLLIFGGAMPLDKYNGSVFIDLSHQLHSHSDEISL